MLVCGRAAKTMSTRPGCSSLAHDPTLRQPMRRGILYGFLVVLAAALGFMLAVVLPLDRDEPGPPPTPVIVTTTIIQPPGEPLTSTP